MVVDAVIAASKHLAKSPAYMAFAFAALAVLGFVAYRNHEPVATAIGLLAGAVFGGGAAKTFVDQKFGNVEPK